MRVAILSTEMVANYGGVLQNYALQERLREMGHYPITMDKVYYTIPLSNYIKAQIKTAVFKLLGKSGRSFYPAYPPVVQRNKNFNRFVKNHINVTHPFVYYSKSILEKAKVSAIIVGSDQVWRRAYYEPDLMLDHYLMFAESLKVRRIAYAASFGIDELDYEETLAEQCKELLHKFDIVSVREHSGIDICKKSFDVEAQLMPDPTLLLDRQDYEKLCDNIPKRTDKFLLSYLLDMDEQMKKTVSEFAHNRGLSVVFCTSDAVNMPSIEEWLGLFRDAEFVITNSFHGTVFSIIFNKEFYAVVNNERGASRFTTLLAQLNLKNHLLGSWHSLTDQYEYIDWNNMNKLKCEIKTKGISFLNESLKAI